MDGVFGIGIPEMIIIVLAVLIVGGPRNAVKWSRDLGRMIRRIRIEFSKMIAAIEKDLGPDGRELMSVTRDITNSINDVRGAANPQNLVRQGHKLISDTVNETKAALKAPLVEQDNTNPDTTDDSSQEVDTPQAERYSAWLPKKD